MNNQKIVSSSPHIRSTASTQRIMLDVIIALLPSAIAGTVIFGLGAALVIAVCVGGAVLSELVFNLITKRPNSLPDLSAAVTGLILALNLHANTPWWQCLIGSVFAIVVVKCLFGGLGCNFANPAITGRILLLISFAGSAGGAAMPKIVELTTTSTPLASLSSGVTEGLPSFTDMLLGLRGGAIGEVCILAILLGFVYLVARKVIYFETPLAFVLTVFVLALLLTNDPTAALYHVLSGGLMFGAVFMVLLLRRVNRKGGCCYLRDRVEFQGELALFTSSGVLVDNTTSGSLVNLFHSQLVCFACGFFVASENSCIEFANSSFHLGLHSLVLKRLGRSYENTLLCRFDIRHFLPPKYLMFSVSRG